MREIDVRAGYDLWAADYDTFDNWLVAMTMIAMRDWRPTGKRVLEIGCGTGRNAPFFLDRGLDYVGVDVSSGMLARAAARVDDPRAQLVLVDVDRALDEAMPGLEVDGVLFSLVLEHVRDVRPMLEQAARIARPGAWLRIFDIHPHLRAKGKQAHFEHDGEEHFLPSHAHDTAELAAAMGTAWRLVSATDWYASPAANAKLARYVGEPVMLDVIAERTGPARA